MRIMFTCVTLSYGFAIFVSLLLARLCVLKQRLVGFFNSTTLLIHIYIHAVHSSCLNFVFN